ncbi:hypothetical protein Leryth_023040 [Lithospermum erythrorhizon]|nr:hypothetical protein Leryth_023040 [Lithospermum erythrorhizon]
MLYATLRIYWVAVKRVFLFFFVRQPSQILSSKLIGEISN